MKISENELRKERKYLKNALKIITDKLSSLGRDISKKEEKAKEFQEYKWNNKEQFDKFEMLQIQTASELEYYFLEQRAKYFKGLFKIQDNPYFGSIDFETTKGDWAGKVYIGITYLEDEQDKKIIYDWRSPICSLFYDYEIGDASYVAPEGKIKGKLKRKRQYKIEKGQLKHIFDNNLNIDDSLLQEVLATDTDDKMKNIVNTIQQEQNQIIRNTNDKNLIVQGIAGSGKTSVALHRIAFLLYKLERLSSDKVLIFSPNQIFTEYISNVLPELGEENTMQTTFHNFLKASINEYKEVESFSEFVGRYYKYQVENIELMKYKNSDEIVNDINYYIDNLVRTVKFEKDIKETDNYYTKEELNEMFHKRYSKYKFRDRLEAMALKMSENNYEGSKQKKRTYLKLLKMSINTDLDFKSIYENFYLSRYCNILLKEENIKTFVRRSKINYEDATLFVYIKGLLEGFLYNNQIRVVVIDEAQDYTRLQYKIITEIFKKSEFTILGDVNQTINPYYKYDTMKSLISVFKGNTSYLELTKTYRSSEEIIAYSNKVLGLDYARAIRKSNNRPVLFRKESNLKEQLKEDIERLQKEYKSIAIITKDDREAEKIYESLNKDFNISLINNKTTEFVKNLVVIAAYVAKGLEFDSVIVYNGTNNQYKDEEKYLYYVAVTRAQHELIIYNE